MNQDTDNSTAEHDVDIADLEDRLYAQIHYEIGDNEAPSPSSENVRKQRDPKSDDKLRSVSAHCMVKNSNVVSSEKNGGRYWAGAVNSRPSSPKSHYSNKESGVYNTLANQVGSRKGAKNASSKSSSTAVAVSSTNKQNSNPIVPSSNKPKVFTPYKPLLSDVGVFSTSSNNNNESIANAFDGHEPCDIEPDATDAGLKETSKLMKNRHKNSVSSSHTKRKNPFAVPPVVSKKEQKRLNPFHHAREANLKVKDKMETKKKKNPEKVASAIVPVTVDEDDEDDEEVIFLPNEPPPLICIDSSDDDAPLSKRKRASAEPGTSKQLLGSPTNSILSADDFIVQTDLGRVENETFCGVSGYDMLNVDRTVERILQRAGGIENIVAGSANEATDAAVFATPQRKKKEKKSKEPVKSYEMSENSFAAVDVYESESSDMPDTIYAKGLTGKRKKASSSSSSEASDHLDLPKSKRLKKRKSSGSAKGSDFPSTNESSSDDNLNDGTVAENIPYLIRGEAVGKVKKSSSRKAKKNLKRKRQQSDKLSDEEFISKLTSIVQGESETSHGDEIDENHETSNESIAARDIVKSVLQKRSKRTKKAGAELRKQSQDQSDEHTKDDAKSDGGQEEKIENETIDTPHEAIDESNNVEPSSNDHESADNVENEQEGTWIVKDQVGEIDANDDDASRDLLNISTSPIQITSFVDEDDQTDDNNGNVEKITPNENVQSAVVTPANEASDLFVFGEQNASAENLEMAWNEEMKCFYNKSWGGEMFKLGRIQARMPRNFTDWTVANIDKFPSRNPHRNQRNSRCMNCHERGHRVHDCQQSPKKVVCYMCGQAGHFEPRCPNKICLKCGQRARAYKFGCEKCEQDAQVQCFVCRLKGHKAAECPDKWRRYHSTTVAAVPLTEHEKIDAAKPKYCSVCSKRGHLAENCHNAYRLMDRPVNSLKVRSYRDAYNTQPVTQKESQPLYTIYSSNVDDFEFNFGKEVSVKSNTIYGRFAQAVDLKRKKLVAVSRFRRPDVSSTITSAEAITTETNNSNKNERTHHFFDENDEPRLEVEECVSEILVATETCPNQTANEVNESWEILNETEESTVESEMPSKQTIVIDETAIGDGSGSTNDLVTGASEISDTSLAMDESIGNQTSAQSEDTERKLNQLKAYDSDMKQLLELKQQLLEQSRLQSIVKDMEKAKSTLSAADSTANCDSDSNYSFSEYYVGKAARKQKMQFEEPSTSALVKLPDFIPLSAGDAENAEERFRETASSPDADSITTKSRSEAKVFLSSDHCKYLLTPTGHNFLKDKEQKHNVVIRLEWSSFGNVLCITGTRRSQDEFRTDLVQFFETLDKKIKSRSEVQIPKNRLQLIKHVSSIIRELNSLSMCNNVHELYHSMRRYEKPNTKASNRKAERCRRFLNMALFGVYGFRDGHKHLQALQENLRQLKYSRETNIAVKFRQIINEHLNYIFSAQPHENYCDLIELYTQMKRSKTLPELNLDRKLLGLPIDVQPNRNTSTSSLDVSSFVMEPIDELPSIQTSTAIPSLMDLKLNVSSLLASPPGNGSEPDEEILPAKIDGSEIPSVEANQYAFWSEKCLELIERIKKIQSNSRMTLEKLSAYEKQARNHACHFSVYSRLFKTLENAIENRNAGL